MAKYSKINPISAEQYQKVSLVHTDKTTRNTESDAWLQYFQDASNFKIEIE